MNNFQVIVREPVHVFQVRGQEQDRLSDATAGDLGVGRYSRVLGLRVPAAARAAQDHKQARTRQGG